MGLHLECRDTSTIQTSSSEDRPVYPTSTHLGPRDDEERQLLMIERDCDFRVRWKETILTSATSAFAGQLSLLAAGFWSLDPYMDAAIPQDPASRAPRACSPLRLRKLHESPFRSRPILSCCQGMLGSRLDSRWCSLGAVLGRSSLREGPSLPVVQRLNL